MFAMLVITLIAVGAAVAAWLRPISDTKAQTAPLVPTYTDQQVADAKAKVCAAYEKVRRAVDVNAARNGGEDPNAQLLVAVNARQVFIAGSAYLLTTLSDEPATPPDLAAVVIKLGHFYQVITLDGLASDLSVPAQNAANETASTIERLCK